MKTLIAGAALLLLLPGFANADVTVPGARMDLTGLPSTTYNVFVPAGFTYAFTATPEGSVLQAVPLSEFARGSGAGPWGCLAIGTTGWVRVLPDALLDCSGAVYASRAEALNEVLLIGAGGASFADALDFNTFGYWFVSCSSPAGISGVARCTESGSFAGFSNWDALTGGTVALSVYQ